MYFPLSGVFYVEENLLNIEFRVQTWKVTAHWPAMKMKRYKFHTGLCVRVFPLASQGIITGSIWRRLWLITTPPEWGVSKVSE